MTFTPGIVSTATAGRLYALRSGPQLCVGEDSRVPVAASEGGLFLGELDGEPCFARWLADSDLAPDGTQPVPLRQLFGVLSDDGFRVAMTALGLTAWERDHRFCGRCGAPTVPSTTERLRTCSRCGHGAYPRISPAVIALVERDGKALLARNARTQMPFFSTLAGFVEVGETLEECLVREFCEEAGIAITDIRYFGSQPWPFTNSLMVGFTAKWAGGELRADPTEIADAAWFAPDEIPRIPPKLSIARDLIDDFVRRHGGMIA
ncbi:MAG TPA: NAD(+) diphosphatase [Kofleriaceae bacterium]|nr:NAD(+) diphosphatase [Kofleriaceae bacterium]